MRNEIRELRVLLVEDDDEDADIFCRHAGLVKRYQLSVVRAGGEREARSRLAAESFNLIFIDFNLMGAGSGMDLLRDLQRGKMDIPAIVVTGSGDEMRAVEAMKLGAYDYLPKDTLSADLLERTVRNVRHRHALQQEGALMTQRLEELSVTDELTGLANRRQLTLKLEEEIRRSDRTGRPFVVLMMDIDHFKQVNDEHGHQGGDNVLKQCATAFRENLRRIDFVARYGGEEFCALLPETDEGGACRAAERLRKAVKALPDPVPTISIGIALGTPNSSAQEIVHQADEALYEAKEAGRDRVVVRGNGTARARSSIQE